MSPQKQLLSTEVHVIISYINSEHFRKANQESEFTFIGISNCAVSQFGHLCAVHYVLTCVVRTFRQGSAV